MFRTFPILNISCSEELSGQLPDNSLEFELEQRDKQIGLGETGCHTDVINLHGLRSDNIHDALFLNRQLNAC